MTLAIIAAMHEELAAVLERMADERRERVAGRDFWVGHLGGRDVVAVLSGIGKVEQNTPQAFFSQPRSERGRQFLSQILDR